MAYKSAVRGAEQPAGNKEILRYGKMPMSAPLTVSSNASATHYIIPLRWPIYIGANSFERKEAAQLRMRQLRVRRAKVREVEES